MKAGNTMLEKRGSVFSGRRAVVRSAARSVLAPWLFGAAIGWAFLPGVQASNPIWINPLTCGTPIASYDLGDSLASPWYVNFEIGQTTWNYAQVGYGTDANGTGYNWGVANWYENGEGSNKRVRRDIGGLKFTATGSWYLICQANESGPDTYTSGSACGWLNSVAYPPASMAYFTVNALNDPYDQSATPDQSSQINLFWSKDAQNHNVMIVRKLASDSWTEPTQGTAYSVSDPIGSGTVVYNGDSTVFYDTGLDAATAYDYKFYSENYSYYSAGVTASATTLKADQTIDFPAIGGQFTTNQVGLAATASSGLSVSFAVGSGPGTIDGTGTNLTFTGAGTVSIVASQAGDGTWNPAPSVTNTFDVTEPPLAVELSQANVNVREAGEGRFFVRLNQDPGTNVAVNVAWSAGDAGITVQDGAVRDFNSGNWNAWQTVTLAAAADGNTNGETATIQVSLAGASDQFLTAAALDDDISENLALATGGSEITSTYAFSRPEQMIDGVHTVNTNYGYTICTSVPPGTITLDMKTTATVSRIRLLTWDWSRLDHRYQIESSADGSSWDVLIDASGADHHGWDDWPVADEACRYLRFTGVSTTQSRDALSVAELEVYGARDLSSLPKAELFATNVNVREAGEGRFFVRLDKEPEGIVIVNVAWASGDPNITLTSGATRSFKASNWSAWQAVSLAASADANTNGETATFRVSIPGRADQFVTATALDDDIGSNLALASAGSTVASLKASRAAQLIDGVHVVSTNYGYTIWTNATRGTITLDMKQTMILNRVRLLNWDWVFRVQRYQIEASTNGTSWSTVADASTVDRAGWDDWDMAGQEARYLRFTGVSNSANQCVVVSELEVYGVSRPLPSVAISQDSVNVHEAGEGRFFVRLAAAPTGNVAVTVSRISGSSGLTIQSGATRSFTALNWNSWQAVTLAAAADENSDGETATFQVSAAGYEDATVTATALDDDIAENVALASGGATIAGWKAGLVAQAIDGIHAASANYGYTIWTNSPKGIMTLDMGAQMTVSRVRLLNWNWNYRVQRYQLEASTDGATWTTLADASASDHAGWDDWPVANQAIRYLRFTGLSNSANSTVVVSELEVYGTRPPARRALSVSAESEPVSVVTSDDVAPKFESGWAAVDGDPETAWIGQKTGGGNIVVEYGPTLELSALEVDLAEGSLADIQYLYSLDAQNWQPLPEDMESNPITLNFLWLLFPGDGTEAVPQVIEIRPNP